MISKDELLEAIDLILDDNFEDAHLVLKHYESPEAAWLRAFLYRKGGDSWNANYWYDKAGRTMPTSSIDIELKEIRTLIENL